MAGVTLLIISSSQRSTGVHTNDIRLFLHRINLASYAHDSKFDLD
jgi:hypothetical protein